MTATHVFVLVCLFCVANCYESNANNIFSQNVTSSTLMPSIGNGFVSTFIGSSEIYIAGLFNGFLDITPSHRAQVPSPINYKISINGQSLQNTGYLLNIEQATFSQFYKVQTGSQNQPEIEQIWYAHQLYRSLIVHEIHVNNTKNSNSLSFTVSNSFNQSSPDITFTEINNQNSNILLNGFINQPEAINGQKVQIAMCYPNFDNNQQSLTVPAGKYMIFYYLATFRTNIDGDSQFPPTDARK